MPSFGKSSKTRLDQCDPRIVEIFEEVVKHIDCSILEGRRDQETQDELYRQGKSKLKWPKSKHNVLNPTDLSRAVDCVPYFATKPHVRWDDKSKFYHFAGFVQAIATMKGYTLRWGGNWDMDGEFHDQTFMDLPHFEIID